ncbi:MAG: DUF1674 domain-containing protein [Alphaproteobacteria bacterium]|nr:DUF1674 domain-containing protein [Alphaproteobacteria bacterium]
MSTKKPSPETAEKPKRPQKSPMPAQNTPETPKEIGGYADAGLLEPTRYGDWETNGRCSDF